MSELATSLLGALARTTLLLAVAALAVRGLLGATRCSSPAAHRAAWLLVLLQGWLFLRWTVAVPYYETPPPDRQATVAHRQTAVAHRQTAAPSRKAPSQGAYRDSPSEGAHEARRPGERERLVAAPRVATSGSIAGVPERESSVSPAEAPPAAEAPSAVAARPGTRRASAASSPAWRTRAMLVDQNWPVWLAAVWLAGMGVLAARSGVRYVLFVRGLPPARPAEGAWVRQWEDLLADQRVRHPIPLRMTTRVGPMLCRLPRGWQLLLPIELWRGLTPGGRASVLRHELAHLRRGDTWKSLGVRLLALPHWFNPTAWWAARKFEEAAEWACDRAAAGGDGEQAVEYARTLVRLGAPLAQRFAWGPSAGGHGLSVRVRRILSTGTGEDSIMKRLIVITVALGLVVACLLRFDLVAKEPLATNVPAAGAPAREDPTEKKTPGEGSGVSVGGGPEVGQATGGPPGMPSGTMPVGQPDVPGGLMPRNPLSSARFGPTYMPSGQMPGATTPGEGIRLPGMPSPLLPGGGTPPQPPGQPPGLQPEGMGQATRRGVRKLPLQSLRYDGKSFEEWKREWKTELKPERRAEAINAFAAFGANGYGEEAAEAILEVMRGLEMQLRDANFSESSFNKDTYVGTQLVKMSAIAAFLHVRPDFRIPPDDAVEVLSRELKTGNRNGRRFAVFVLRNMGHEAKAAIPALREAFEGDEDTTVRSFAYLTLNDLLPGYRMSASALGDLIEDAEPPADSSRRIPAGMQYAEPQALGQVLQALVPAMGCQAGSVFQPKRSATSGFDPDAFPHDMRGYLGPRELRPDALPLVETLVAALDSDAAAARTHVIAALMRIGPEVQRVEGVVPALVRASEDPATRSWAIQALGRLGPEVEGVVPSLVRASEDPATRRMAIEALGGLDPEVEGVLPALVRAFEQGTVDDRIEVLETLEDLLRATPQEGAMGMDGSGYYGSGDMGMGMGMGMPRYAPAGMEGYAEEDLGGAKPALPPDDLIPVLRTLIQTLDARSPADLRMIARIYAEFGPLVPEARLILQKAAQDEDEEVRRAAKGILEWVSTSRAGHDP
jgi:beta-lactamase regulating signal transducer with metallopeptidase domain